MCEVLSLCVHCKFSIIERGMQKSYVGGGVEQKREVNVYKYIVDFVCVGAEERNSKTIASRQTWSESINSKTVFMSVVTSLQIFDNIQLINPNIAVPFCTPCLLGFGFLWIAAMLSIIYPLQRYQLHVHPKIANVVQTQTALNPCDCLNSGSTILQIQISNIFELNIN